MIIVGAKGFAKEILDIQYKLDDCENLVFFDDLNANPPNFLYNKYPVLKTVNQASTYFKSIDNRFTLGLGSPILRKNLYDKFISIGGEFTSTISNKARINNYGVQIENGCNIMDHAIISADVQIGIGCLIYFNAIVTHNVVLGDFVEVSPGASILGRSSIGDYSQIGSQSVILPDINIGRNVIVAAGAIVTKDVPDNCMVAGVPAVIKKTIEPLSSF